MNKLTRKLQSLWQRFVLLHKDRVELLDARDLQSFCLLDEDRRSMCYPLCIWDRPNENPFEVESPQLYHYSLSNCVFIGGSQCVLTERGFYNDMLSLCQCNDNYNVTDRGLLQAFSHVVNYNRKYVVLSDKKDVVHVDKAVSLLSHYAANYYHFIYEVVSKFYILDKIGIGEDYVFLVDSKVKSYPTMYELLNLFVNDSKIIWVDNYKRVEVDYAICVACPHFIPPNFHKVENCQYEDVVFNVNALLYIRDTILNKSDLVTNNHIYKEFFISRRGCSNRGYNESELLDVAKDFNLDVVYPQDLSFTEQVKLFNSAKTIVAASGAALSNILFCQKGCNVICIVSSDYKLPIFTTIAGAVGVNMTYIVGESKQKSKIQSGFYVNPDYLKKILQKIANK